MKVFQSKGTNEEISKEFNIRNETVTKIQKRQIYEYITKGIEGHQPFPCEPGTFVIK